MDSSDLQARITATKNLITVYEAALLALGTDGTQSYILDTGQTRQTVTRMDLKNLNSTLDVLYNRCIMLNTRLNGGSAIIGRGAW